MPTHASLEKLPLVVSILLIYLYFSAGLEHSSGTINPFFLQNELNITTSFGAVLSGIDLSSKAGDIAAGVVWPTLSDYVSAWLLVGWLTGATVGARLGVGLATSIVSLFTARFLLGFFGPGSLEGILSVRLISAEQLPYQQSAMQTAMYSSQLLGQALTAFNYQSFGWFGAHAAIAILTAGIFIPWALFPPSLRSTSTEPASKADGKKEAPRGSEFIPLSRVVGSRNYWVPTLIGALGEGQMGPSYTSGAFYVQHLHLSLNFLAAFSVCVAVVRICVTSCMIVPRFHSAVGSKSTIIVGLAITIASNVVRSVSFCEDSAPCMLAAVTVGDAFGRMIFLLPGAFIFKKYMLRLEAGTGQRFPLGRVSTIGSLITNCFRLVTTAAGGVLYDRFGYRSSYLGLAAIQGAILLSVVCPWSDDIVRGPSARIVLI